jgi:hypothetical protein
MGGPYDLLFSQSPALKLLRSEKAAFVLGFLQEIFKEEGVILVPEEDLEVTLNSHLEALRAEDPEVHWPEAKHYLELWCGDENRYLRKSFSEDKGCYVYQLTRHSEKALSWLEELRAGEKRGYATSESRFSRILSEMRRLQRETNSDPEARLSELRASRDAIDAEIAGIKEKGAVPTLARQQVKDALHDLEEMVSSFLSDFREIEDNFKEQAREIHELYLKRHISKGDLIAYALDADDALRNQDQGRSYYGFRRLIRSVRSREELRELVETVTELAGKQNLDGRSFDGLLPRLFNEVAVVQDAYRRISGQLRRIVEEQSLREQRYLVELMGEVRALAYKQRFDPPEQSLMEWEENLRFNNLMEAPFYEPTTGGQFQEIERGDPGEADDVMAAIRRIGKPLDLPRFRRRVEEVLEERVQVSLRELVEIYPLEDGAVDLLCYVAVAAEREGSLIHSEVLERFDLQRPFQPRFAELDQVIFHRQ